MIRLPCATSASTVHGPVVMSLEGVFDVAGVIADFDGEPTSVGHLFGSMGVGKDHASRSGKPLNEIDGTSVIKSAREQHSRSVEPDFLPVQC